MDRESFNTLLKLWAGPIINPPPGPRDDDKGLPVFVDAEPFRQFAQEWAMQIELEEDPLGLVNLTLEYLREAEYYRLFSFFILWINIREWPRVKEALSKHLNTKGKEALSRPAAEPFYRAFKEDVLRNIRDYWKALEEGQPMGD